MLQKVPHGEKGGLKTETRDWKYLISALNSVHISLVEGFHWDGQEWIWGLGPLCTHIHWSLFSSMGGQTIFIWSTLKYTYSGSINLNLRCSAVRHYATAVLSQVAGPKEERWHSRWLCPWLIVCHFLDSQYSAKRWGRACLCQRPPHPTANPRGCSPLTTKAW